MKALRFDLVGGASGDMTLAALIALGAPVDRLLTMLRSLPIEALDIEVESARSKGIAGTRVHVRVDERASDAHAHGHAHGHHQHRRLSDIRRMLESAEDLPKRPRATAIRVFTRLAEAEAKVHGCGIEDVHFHEVGAMDSIVDVVGSCLAFDFLEIEKTVVSIFPLGIGNVECAHGVMPLPVPATVELLRTFATEQTDEPFELVTPTGAALLTAFADCERLPLGARVVAVGYGLGHRELTKRANALRATLFDIAARGDAGSAEPERDCVMLESNLDNTSPEVIGYAVERLLAEGALDVFAIPIQMKKQRPGVLLSVLCRESDRARLLEIMFVETSTLGVRERTVQRTCLRRAVETVSTRFGQIPVKLGFLGERQTGAAPEYEACRAAAERHGVALKAVYAEALEALAALQGAHVCEPRQPSF